MTDLDDDIVSFGVWMNEKDPEFKGCKFLRWFGFTFLTVAAQLFISIDARGEYMEKLLDIAGANKIKKSGKDHDLTS